VALPIVQAQNDPIIRADTRLVQVDVTVRNGKGPIRGLTKDDFTLFDKGKRQGASDVRFRKGYLASAQPALTEKQKTEAMRQLFATPLDASAIGLTAHAVEDSSCRSTWLLTLALDLHDIHLEPKDALWAGSVAVAFSLESAKPPTMRLTTIPPRLNEKQLKVA
jgi:hypothetical protein